MSIPEPGCPEFRLLAGGAYTASRATSAGVLSSATSRQPGGWPNPPRIGFTLKVI